MELYETFADLTEEEIDAALEPLKEEEPLDFTDLSPLHRYLYEMIKGTNR